MHRGEGASVTKKFSGSSPLRSQTSVTARPFMSMGKMRPKVIKSRLQCSVARSQKATTNNDWQGPRAPLDSKGARCVGSCGDAFPWAGEVGGQQRYCLISTIKRERNGGPEAKVDHPDKETDPLLCFPI